MFIIFLVNPFVFNNPLVQTSLQINVKAFGRTDRLKIVLVGNKSPEK